MSLPMFLELVVPRRPCIVGSIQTAILRKLRRAPRWSPRFSPRGGIRARTTCRPCCRRPRCRLVSLRRGRRCGRAWVAAKSHVGPMASDRQLFVFAIGTGKSAGTTVAQPYKSGAPHADSSVVLMSVVDPVDAPRIHVDREHRIRVGLSFLVEVVAVHGPQANRNVRIGIAGSAPRKFAVLSHLRRCGRLGGGDIDLAPGHIDRRIMPVGRSAKESLGPQQRSQRLRQLMIGVIPDVGMSFPENLPVLTSMATKLPRASSMDSARPGRPVRHRCSGRPWPSLPPNCRRREDHIVVPLIDPVIFAEGCVSAFVLQTT